MSTLRFFIEEWAKVFLIHKNNLIEKTFITEKKRQISTNDYPKFNQEFERFQKQISKNLTKL
jgi:hypothetical protein